jgi:exonuclease V gamma subunit
MKKILPFLLLATLLTLHTGCASWKQNRWLAAHQKELKRLADSNLTPEQKLDGLVQDYIKFMNEDLKFINPVKGVKYVKKYHDQNRASMDKILKASEKWQGNLGTVDNVKDLIDLVPKFKRKYKQYAFALELASKIGGGLTRFAGKDLF